MRQRRIREHNEELAAIGVRPRIRHRHYPSLVAELIRWCFGINFVGEGIPGSATAGTGRVTTLDHESFDDTVEDNIVIKILLCECNKSGNCRWCICIKNFKRDVVG